MVDETLRSIAAQVHAGVSLNKIDFGQKRLPLAVRLTMVADAIRYFPMPESTELLGEQDRTTRSSSAADSHGG